MNIINKILKWFLYLVAIKILFVITFTLVSWILTQIIVNPYTEEPCTNEIFLSDNGIHVDVVIPEDTQYIAYGWGSEIFYLNTPTWEDLTFKNAFKALFTDPTSVMHVTTYINIQNEWIRVGISNKQLRELKRLINDSFKLDDNKNRIKFEGKGYHQNDEFYKANGNYSCFMTCNS